jgi:hypothetical protein
VPSGSASWVSAKTGAGRNPTSTSASSPVAALGSFLVIGAQIQIAFSPGRTRCPSSFQRLTPATSPVSGRWARISRQLCQE